MPDVLASSNQPAESLTARVRSAVIWRSGSQIAAQLVQWAATFLVIRILSPSDYGLFAMTGVVLAFLNMLNGYGLAGGIVRQETVSRQEIRQLFGMLLLLNGSLALLQVALAPLAAAYYRQPEVATLLRAQALLYIPTPFIGVAYAILSRELDYRGQAKVNMAAAVASAAAALAGALAGLGVWTLVVAPMVLFGVRAFGMTIAARSLMRPSFDFRGTGTLARFGATMATGQLFWFLQSQADVFVGGRVLTPHELGIYTTSLFLVTIFVAKFVPALNEVAFSAYARIQHDRAATAAAFAKAVRVIMVVGLPFYAGLAVTAEPLVAAVLGPHWVEAAPVVRVLACAMPLMTLQVLLAPACDAAGRPGVGVGNGIAGALILGSGFLVGAQWGMMGLAWAWLAAYPLYLVFSLWRALPVIGTAPDQLVAAIAPPALAAVAMAAIVLLVDTALPPLAPPLHLATLVAVGAASYAAWLLLFARDMVTELLALVRGR